jgi:hypothetical protein
LQKNRRDFQRQEVFPADGGHGGFSLMRVLLAARLLIRAVEDAEQNVSI